MKAQFAQMLSDTYNLFPESSHFNPDGLKLPTCITFIMSNPATLMDSRLYSCMVAQVAAATLHSGVFLTPCIIGLFYLISVGAGAASHWAVLKKTLQSTL
jgi:hypothetical protein